MGETDTTKWPGVRTPVELLTHHWPDWLPSRIEDLDHKRMVVAAPTTPTIPFLLPDPGDSVKLQWLSARGPCEFSALVESCRRGTVPAWIITATSAPSLHQRRRFARIMITLPVAFAISGSESDTSTTLNISEGGMTCAIPRDRVLVPGDFAEAIVNLDGDPFYARAVCLRTETNEAGRLTASFQFEQLEPQQADRIRRFIFQEELRRRAGGRS